MERPLKIAIYSGEIPSTTFIERLIQGLSREGVAVLLFGVLKHAPKYPESVRVLGYCSSRFYKFMYLLRYSLLLGLFRNQDKRRLDAFLRAYGRSDLYSKVKCYPVLWQRPDVFHVQWAKGLEDWLWVQDFGIKLVLSLRGAHINYSPIADPEVAAMYRRCFPKVDGFHAVSKAIGLEAEQYGARPERVHVVYSGLDLKSVDTPISSEDSKILRLISVGRSHWIKGYSYTLDACKLLKDSGMGFKYLIVGGANMIEYQYQVHDLGLELEVELLEGQSYEAVQHLIGRADLLLLPSVKEGIANVVLEAMALGTLVVSTNCGGMAEVIRDGENGFLVPIRDSQAIAEAVMRVQSLPESKLEAIRAKAQATITAQHDEAIMVKGMLALYREVSSE
ncbi:glycosyltransferase [Mangrovimonas xylaniphaga]|uniref:glycosyltransferase n=1 Tax=Mangrovimonas xylaniphaga TaxID=1645915 RepID=UPI0006B50FBA|nr:glycosyltransferase [Mangrovimonas xylaniphaga]